MHPMVAARGVLAAMQRTWKSRAPTKQEKKIVASIRKILFHSVCFRFRERISDRNDVQFPKTKIKMVAQFHKIAFGNGDKASADAI